MTGLLCTSFRIPANSVDTFGATVWWHAIILFVFTRQAEVLLQSFSTLSGKKLKVP